MEVVDSQVMLSSLSARQIASSYGTPLFVYDAASIRRRARSMLGIPYRPLRVLYSVKSNAAVRILDLLRELGISVDVCSHGDILAAEAAGFLAADMSYVGHSITDEELDLVVQRGIFFTADSIRLLERYGQRAPGMDVALRINCGITAGFHAAVQAGATRSKFGIHLPRVAEALAVAKRHSLRVIGLHSHLGSELLNPEPHLEVLRRLIEVSSAVTHLRFVNVGGGWGTPFLPGDEEYDLTTFGRRASELLETESKRRGEQIELRLEPGGYLVMDSGVLLTRVTEVKPSVEVDGEATPWFACTDTSSNHVPSAVIYNTQHPMWIADRADHEPRRRYDVTGNLMQAGDILARDRQLPEVREGDVLVIGKCGGYTYSRAATFNERPRPAEVLVDSGVVTVIRQAERPEALL